MHPVNILFDEIYHEYWGIPLKDPLPRPPRTGDARDYFGCFTRNFRSLIVSAIRRVRSSGRFFVPAIQVR